jgi:hypothetical protein
MQEQQQMEEMKGTNKTKETNAYDRVEDFPSGYHDDNVTANIHEYMQQLSNTQLMAYRIAKRHLGSSFNLIRSNGFIEWLKDNK